MKRISSDLSGHSATWSFENSVSIDFGRGVRDVLLSRLNEKKFLLVCSKRGFLQFKSDPVLSKLLIDEYFICYDEVVENPSIQSIQVAIDALRLHSVSDLDAIVAFGGGSAIDVAKIIKASLFYNPKNYSLIDLLAEPSMLCVDVEIPLYALPTTSGTGSEVTPFATCWDHTHSKKYSLSSSYLCASNAIIDPFLTDSLPIDFTTFTALDAINQAAESIWNKKASPITIALATRSLILSTKALIMLFKDNNCFDARDSLSEASLLAGLAISNTRTALCHSISYPITARFQVPHGLACAFTMSSVLKINIQADDGRLLRLCYELTNSTNYQDLISYFDELLISANVCSQVKEYVPNLNALLELEPEMITPGRADNNMADCFSLRNILTESWNANS